MTAMVKNRKELTQNNFNTEYLKQLEDFKLFLLVEKGLSVNTVDSYEFDLISLKNYLLECGLQSITEICQTNLENYLGELYADGKAHTTLARHLALSPLSIHLPLIF